MDQGDIIERLRQQIERIERRPARRGGFAGTGRPEVDSLLPGRGFPCGALSEIVGGPASGKTGLALSAMAFTLGSEGLAAFVDGCHELYPPAAQAMGVDLARLLIIRPRPAGDRVAAWRGLWASELLLASGAFALVAVDLRIRGERSARIEPALRRLQLAAEKGGSVAIWLGEPGQGYRVPAAVRLELDPGGKRVTADRVRSVPLLSGSGASHAA